MPNHEYKSTRVDFTTRDQRRSAITQAVEELKKLGVHLTVEVVSSRVARKLKITKGTIRTRFSSDFTEEERRALGFKVPRK